MENYKIIPVLTFDNIVFHHTRTFNMSSGDYDIHYHEGIELIYIVEADGYHVVEDREYKLSSCDLVVVPPGTYHGMKLNAGSDYERYNISFDKSFIEDIDIGSIFDKIKVINCPQYSIIFDLFKKTNYYFQKLEKRDFTNLLKLIIKEIFYNLSIYDGSFDNESRFLNPILSKAIEYINKSLYEIKSVTDISNELYISKSYLFKIFEEQLKISPKKYINAKKLHLARQDIELGAKPTQIYEKYGFNSYASFYRSYTSFFKHPPSKGKSYGYSNEKF